MKIRDLMISDPITIPKGTTIEEAIGVMKTNSIRHLPVVSKAGRLEGFVTLADLKQGLIPSMVAALSLADLMITSPITVRPEVALGQEVEVAHGPLRGFRGPVVAVLPGAERVRVLLEFLGNEQAIELDLFSILLPGRPKPTPPDTP